MDVNVDMKYVLYFFIQFLIYRSYKRYLSNSITLLFHVFVAICLYLVLDGQCLEGMLNILFFPPLPQNFLMVLLWHFLIQPILK